MQRYVSWTDPGSVEGAFFRAVFAVHQENFESAQAAIDRARRLLAADLTALVGESYDRAYRKIVTVQQLSEMEEVVTYMRLRAHGSAEAAHSYISNVRKMWDARLRGCQRSVSVWHRILSVRSLIVVASEDADSWIKFASLCRSTGRLNMSHKVLHGLGMDGSGGLRSHYVEPSGTGNRYPEAVGFLRYGSEPGSYGGVVEGFSRQVAGGLKRVHARVFYAHTKHLWDSGNSEDALQRLTALVGGLETTIGNSARGISETLTDHASELFRVLPSIQCSVEGMNSEMLNNLRVKAYLRQGQWHLALADRDGLLTAGQGKLTEYAKSISPALNSFKKATNIGPENYNAWHTWAVLNYTAATEYDKYTGSSGEEAGRPRVLRSSPVPTSDDDEGELASEDVNKHVTIHSVAAIRGFFRSISLGRRRLRAEVLQDLLRLLTLWFTHGGTPEVHSTLEEQLDSIPIHTWLHVIPQLVARIHISVRPIQRLLHQLLARVGDTHPQALIYPLTVASKSSFAPRREAALTLMRSLRQRHKSLVDQADMVSQELIRVAILWEELWHSTLEEASRLYFGDKNIPAMLNALLPLHELMARGATTMRELAFQQAFGEQLTKAFNWLKRYQETQHVADLNVAWDHYYSVYTRINNQLPSITHLNLQFVSPSLTSSHNLELAVPGTYTAGYFASSFSGYGAKEGQRGDIFPVVCIAGFEEDVQVLSSKQRPRKITIRGSNGRRYLFLLKGHEDLRQDERVMQLFGLVNALLGNDPDTRKRDLSIRRYTVTPLSHDAGVVGWLPSSDTLHTLIIEFRDARRVIRNIEHRLMVQMAPMHEQLTLAQKVEVFEFALENTTGLDLYKVLWLKSDSSEVWLQRRTNYTRSLAVMSMVGYVLGLGDRHPSNLMLDRRSGKILHIDFGDCFEVAMNRDKFPEKIPFRLTRMLVKAMEDDGESTSSRGFPFEEMVSGERKDGDMDALRAKQHLAKLSMTVLFKLLEEFEINSLDGTLGM
ncbi:tor [Symbiodinium sp. KB8]|nr:tor [Symbiodinium sp. KB8]